MYPINFSDLFNLDAVDVNSLDRLLIRHLNGGPEGPTKFFTLTIGNLVTSQLASQAEAEAGTVADKLMTPLRTAQAIAELVTPPNWGNITGTLADQTDLQNALDAKISGVSWGDITGTLADQTDLQNALDAKISGVSWGDITGTLADQTDLQNALDAKISGVSSTGGNGDEDDGKLVRFGSTGGLTASNYLNTYGSGGTKYASVYHDDSDSYVASSSGNLILNAPTSADSIKITNNGNTRAQFLNTQAVFSPSVSSAATSVRFKFTGAADTSLTASTEAPSVHFNSGQTRQHATGALTLQRDFRVTGSTHSAAGASTITDAAAFAVDGPPIAGTNATITNSHGIYVPTLALSGTITNAYGATIVAPSGATNNYAIKADGKVITTSGHIRAYVPKTTTYQVTTADDHVICNHATIPFAVTLPALASSGGSVITVKNKGAAVVTVATDATIDGSSTATLNQNESMTIINDTVQWNII